MDMERRLVMGTMEGFLLGTALAPQPGYDSGPIWEATAKRNKMAALEWKAEAEKLSEELDKEHQRFLIERRERRSYMRGWAVRGQVLREMCGYDEDRLESESDVINNKYDDKIVKMADEKDAEIDQLSGF
jgi:hypothetical protein